MRTSRVARSAWAAAVAGLLGVALLTPPLPASAQAAPGSPTTVEDFDRAALERIVSGQDAADRGEQRRQAAVARQFDLNAYLPWRSGLGPGSYYFGAPYYGYPYVGAVEQPLGHRILSAGAKGYIYEPVHADDVNRGGEPLQAEQAAASPRGLSAAGKQYLREGIEAFQAQKYEQALKALHHLDVEAMPHYPAELLRSQVYFALGEYELSADSLRAALTGLPEPEWGLLVENYLDYYLLGKPFQLQLRKLETFAAAHPDSSSAALLLGYEYGYLGYPAAAAPHLAMAVKLTPDDRIARRLAERFAALADKQPPRRGVRQATPPKPENAETGPREF